MTWITPKTDWVKSDNFAYIDYNRIRNNLLYINDVLNNMYPDVARTLDLGSELSYSGHYIPSQFNAFENALESFTRIGVNVNIGSKKTFTDNSPFIDYAELNRLESCCLRWYSVSSKINSADMSPKSASLKPNDTLQLQLFITPSTAVYTVVWSSSDNTILTVNNGLVTALSGGEAVITATIKQDGFADIVLTSTIMVDANMNGTIFYYKGSYYYYDFVVVGQNVDGSGVTTIMPVYAYSGLRGGMDGTNFANGQYLNSIQDYIETNFSTQMENALLTATKKEISNLFTGNLIDVERKYFLPAINETNAVFQEKDYVLFPSTLGGSQYVGLNTGTKRFGTRFDDDFAKDWELLARSGAKKKTESLYTATAFNQTGAEMCGTGMNGLIRPLFFISGSKKVSRNNENIYSLDWTNSASTTLGSLPIGSIIRDDTGTKKEIVEATAISINNKDMYLNELTTLAITVTPANATHRLNCGYTVNGFIGESEIYNNFIDFKPTALGTGSFEITVFCDDVSTTETINVY